MRFRWEPWHFDPFGAAVAYAPRSGAKLFVVAPPLLENMRLYQRAHTHRGTSDFPQGLKLARIIVVLPRQVGRGPS
jgi:hypothetical protein